MPESAAGITIALADRLDSLTGLLSVGLAPTGSADPYGLRRTALGLVQLLLDKHISLDLRQVIGWSAQTQAIEVSQKAQDSVLEFIIGRLRGVLKETCRHDVAEAVLGAIGYDPYLSSIHADQLAAQVSRPDWQPILDAYSRCVRITRDLKESFTIRPKAFTEPAEKRLYESYQQAAQSIGSQADVNMFITTFEPLAEPIAAFFAPAAEGGVLVMDPDPKVRENRLALLQHIVMMGTGVADFSQLEGF
jgi:glycyl-tRNA synthetase